MQEGEKEGNFSFLTGIRMSRPMPGTSRPGRKLTGLLWALRRVHGANELGWFRSAGCFG
jgi:hypothetical protein